MTTRYDNPTAKAYQSGKTREEAEYLGLDLDLFDSLEKEFNGGSIPAHLIHGFPYQKPYSCEYHTGGVMGEQLRDIIKKHNKELNNKP